VTRDAEGRPPAGRLPGIEGLRAIAAFALVGYHLWLAMVTPALREAHSGLLQLRYGVVLFFVLSGFLLYGRWVAAVLGGRPSPSVRRYAVARVLRIVPAYWTILLISSFVLQVTITRFPQTGALTDPDTLIANLLLLQNFRLDTLLTGIGPAWSLAVEAMYYVALPLLGAGALWLGRRATTANGRLVAVLVPVLGSIAVGLATRGVIGGDASGDQVLAHSLLAHADLFGFGMLVAVLYGLAGAGRLAFPPAVIPLTVAVLGLGVLGLTGPQDGGHPGGSTDPVAGVCFALVLCAVLSSAASPLTRALEWRPVVAAGRWSYSVFLWHLPLMSFIVERTERLDTRLEALAMLAGVTALTLALSAATYRFIEAPALARKDRRGDAAPVPVVSSG
jgi:peptidoglycan/LPS O-acetylase OafA/YrhL